MKTLFPLACTYFSKQTRLSFVLTLNFDNIQNNNTTNKSGNKELAMRCPGNGNLFPSLVGYCHSRHCFSIQIKVTLESQFASLTQRNLQIKTSKQNAKYPNCMELTFFKLDILDS